MGIPTVEHFFYTYITNYFSFLKQNPYLVDYILNTKDVHLKTDARKLVERVPISCYLMFPRANFKVPFISISVSVETVGGEYIGDTVGPGYPVEEREVNGEVLNVVHGETQLSHFPIRTLQVYRDGVLLPDDAYLVDHYTGRIIISEPWWQAGAVYTANYTYFTRYFDEVAYLNAYTTTFHVVSNNTDEVVTLHRLLYNLFLSDRVFLAALGMKNQKLSSGELSPEFASDQPEPLYGRYLSFSFDMEASGVLLFPVLRDIQVVHA